jgi:hypothetical protein
VRQLALALLLLGAAPVSAEAAARAEVVTPPSPTLPTPPVSDADRAERARIAETMIAEAGGADMLDKMMSSMFEQLLPALSDVNKGREAEIRKILTEEFAATFKTAAPAILNKSRDLYAERFTVAELNEILAFNRSPTGRKASRLMPEIQLEMMSFGQDVGKVAVEAVLPRIIDRLKAADLAVPTAS